MKAWEHEWQFRKSLNPLDYRTAPDWSSMDGILSSRKNALFGFWKSQVPGSWAPDSLFYTAVQAWGNQGYDVTEAEALLEGAEKAHAEGNWGELERTTGLIFLALNRAPADKNHIWHRFDCPQTWEQMKAAMPGMNSPRASVSVKDTESKTINGWLAQICGGSYGTALEGYTGDQLTKAYGEKLSHYVIEPETWNDDITFQIALLNAAEISSENLTSDMIAEQWLNLIYFGWSAEYFALENLRRGLFPPLSGSFCNYFSEWIGAQMRTMVCGLLAPGNPARAAEMACRDSLVSHTGNGVYAGIHAAVLTSLAFVMTDIREILKISREYIPSNTLFLYTFDLALKAAGENENSRDAWNSLQNDLKTYHWIHALPNMAAVVVALWFGEGDLGKTFRILGECGLDVDCNAGEAGTVLGVLNNQVPENWSAPFDNTLQTYVPGFESLKIDELGRWTSRLGEKLGKSFK